MELNRKGRIFYGFLFATGLLTAVLGLPIPLTALVAATLLMGTCLAVNNLVWSVVLQARVPRPVLGRVASLSNVSSAALLPVGFALAGVAVDLAGAPQVFILGGLLTALLALTGLWFPTTRRI
jgi:DHA3 family tetracycline resistance protein-like MFS transporter